MCIRLKKEERPLVKDLLNHEFFADDVGLKLEMVSRDSAVADIELSRVEFRLRVLDPKKRSNKHKENEAIQFDFDILADNAEEVALEMAKSSLILEEDAKAVAKMLKSQITTLLREREERKAKEEKERLDRETAATDVTANAANAENLLQQQLLLQQMQLQQQQQQQIQSNIGIQMQNPVSIQLQQTQMPIQQQQLQSTAQQAQQHNLQAQQVQLVQQQPIIQQQTSVVQPQQAQQIQYQQQIQQQYQQQQQQQYSQHIPQSLNANSPQCSTPQNVQAQPQFPQVSQQIQQQQQQQHVHQQQQYIQLNQMGVPQQIPHQMQQQIQPQMQMLPQQQHMQQLQQQQYATQPQLQHVQQLHQHTVNSPVQNQQYYQQSATGSSGYVPAGSLYQQTMPQQIFHTYTTSTNPSGHVEILSSTQTATQIYSHTSLPAGAVPASSQSQFIPSAGQVQASIPSGINVNNTSAVTHIQNIPTSTIPNIQSAPALLGNTGPQPQSQQNILMQMQYSQSANVMPNSISITPNMANVSAQSSTNLQQQQQPPQPQSQPIQQHFLSNTDQCSTTDRSSLIKQDTMDSIQSLPPDQPINLQQDQIAAPAPVATSIAQQIVASNDG